MTYIINSLLDLDLYKFTMGQLLWRKHGTTEGLFKMHNRTTRFNLVEYVDLAALQAELNHVQQLRFTESELIYLLDSGFDPDYINFLRHLQLPPIQAHQIDGQLEVAVRGRWAEITYWETIVLAIVNELFCRGYMRKHDLDYEVVIAEGTRRLQRKIELLERYPGLRFVEFGTRRRFGLAWQRTLNRLLMKALPKQIVGVSNVQLAMELGQTPAGTFAHELPMGYTALADDLDTGQATGHRQMLEDWFAEHGYLRSIALTDTYGTDFFLTDFIHLAADWKGVRHDSGDPFGFGEKMIQFYTELGIDPLTKTLVFSDGLDVELIEQLYLRFYGRIKLLFGWGTTLTNDLGIPTPSLVMKLYEVNGRGTVKLSDNVQKAMGNPDDVAKAIELFQYDMTAADDRVLVV